MELCIFFTNFNFIPICISCKQSVSDIKENTLMINILFKNYIYIFNIKRYYDINHDMIHGTFVGKLRDEKFEK